MGPAEPQSPIMSDAFILSGSQQLLTSRGDNLTGHITHYIRGSLISSLATSGQVIFCCLLYHLRIITYVNFVW